MRIRIQEANLLNTSYWLSRRPYIRRKLFYVRNSFFLVLRSMGRSYKNTRLHVTGGHLDGQPAGSFHLPAGVDPGHPAPDENWRTANQVRVWAPAERPDRTETLLKMNVWHRPFAQFVINMCHRNVVRGSCSKSGSFLPVWRSRMNACLRHHAVPRSLSWSRRPAAV
jgi:hypothetical protein